MKKSLLAIIAILSVLPFISKAQSNTFPSSGNVGIGTTSPGALQEIFQSSGGTNGLRLNTNFSGGNAIDLNPFIPGVNNGGFSISQSGNIRLVIGASGNVGIGATNPTNNLQIGTLSGVSTSSPVTLSLGATFSSTHGINPKLKVYDDGVNTWGLGVSSGQLDYIVSSGYDHVFYSGGAELTRMKSNGYVGIGTSTPDEMLSVNGTIHSKEVKINLTGLPDYVFKPTYRLPTLAEVKAYIDKNQHLPEIPSAAEVEKNGLNLGEMNKLLLKKVEELTIYIIKKDEELKEQRAKANDQDARLRKLEAAIKASKVKRPVRNHQKPLRTNHR